MARSIDVFFHVLLPRDHRFIPLFGQAAANLVETARTLDEALKSDSVKRIQAHERIEWLEKQGDEITHAIQNEVASTFIIPFDREDIQALANALDDVVDFTYAASKSIDLYKIHQISPSVIRLGEIILEASKEMEKAIAKMHSLREMQNARSHLASISRLEAEADKIMNNSIAHLFAHETNAAELLKQKEVITLLENATDRCKNAANVIEGVLIKFS